MSAAAPSSCAPGVFKSRPPRVFFAVAGVAATSAAPAPARMISRSSVKDSLAAAAGSAPAAAFAASSAATSAPASKPASTAAARLAFRAATARMPSSTEDAWHMRITVTGRFWPSLCARSCACWSYVGFQSGSARITVSALCRLIPKPPARVLHR